MKIEFETSNDAFDQYGVYEILRILEKIKEQVKLGFTSGDILDINGNEIGYWKY